MVDETGLDETKVEETAVDKITVDEPGPHSIGRHLKHPCTISRELYELIKHMRKQWYHALFSDISTTQVPCP